MMTPRGGPRYVAAGDRFEKIRPGYAAVKRQRNTPRQALAVTGAQITPDHRTLSFNTSPQSQALSYAITMPATRPAPAQGEIKQHETDELAYDLAGVAAEWQSFDGATTQSIWLPHPDLSVSRAFTSGSAEHDGFWKKLKTPGRLTLRTFNHAVGAGYHAAMAVPRMYRVRQSFHRDRLADIPAGVRAAMSKGSLPIKRGDTVAVGAGSRGIANIAVIVRAVVDHLKDLGAKPFVFPAMGSHGGATAEGQLEILAHYGITEAAMGCPVRASMDVVQAGEALGMPVWCDRIASEADWIGIVNRVKPHTDFKGSIESGLFKMMTIGLGKYRGATQYHQANVTHGYETVITAVGREMLAKARIGFGLGVVENGYDETAVVEAFNAENLEAGERRLLKDAREWMARLPFSPIDVLVVEEVGKNISGSGMDTNVIGRPSNPHEPFPSDPKILWIVALDLTEDSGGNATGIGNADFTTKRLAEKIDWKKTAINSLTACAPNGAKLPLTFDSDREAVESALNCIGLTKPEQARVIRIKNTLMIGELECSEAFLPDIQKRPDLEIVGEAQPLPFDAAGQIVSIGH